MARRSDRSRSPSLPGLSTSRVAAGLLACLFFFVAGSSAAASSLRFFGHGVDDIDRVKILIDAPDSPADIGAGDFTIELWVKANPGENATAACEAGLDGWIHGDILLDRDVWGPGDHGDFGLSVSSQGVAFGVAGLQGWGSLCGQTPVCDGAWHHIAVTRAVASGELRLFVDGWLDAMGSGPAGDLSYRHGRSGYPNGPYLVLGAEKHDAGAGYPSFRGWIDELRLSTVVRYDVEQFPRPQAPFAPDAYTAALYHFDEGSGLVAGDGSGHPSGPSHGTLHVGGSPAGPAWSAETPFAGASSPDDPYGNGGSCPDENCGMVFSDGPVHWGLHAAPNPIGERCVLTLRAHTADGSLPVAPGSFQSDDAIDPRVPRALTVHDPGGRVVARLLPERTENGAGAPSLRFSWDGRGRSGERVASGLYWARVESDPRVRTRLIVIR